AKTTIAAYFAFEQCKRNQRTVYFAFEESPQQLLRNMQSIGVDLGKYVKNGTLQIHSSRPSLNGLELHLLTLRKMIKNFKPETVIIDPISNLITIGNELEVRSMLVRLIDMLKYNNITALFTSLIGQTDTLRPDMSEESISSLVDTWISVRDMEGVGERNRGIFIIKSRGMGHSNQVREFVITGNGIELLEVEMGPEGILTGAARQTNAINIELTRLKLEDELNRKDRDITRKRNILQSNIEALRNEFESAEEELGILKATEEMHARITSQNKTSKGGKK
ncbi:MAG TPA: ATPase domain-containing protein, partial [Flavobacterium sp.]